MKTAKIVPTPNSFDTNWHPHLLKSLAVWASIVVMLLLIFFLAFKFEKFIMGVNGRLCHLKK